VRRNRVLPIAALTGAAFAAALTSSATAHAAQLGPGELIDKSTSAALPQGILAQAIPSDLLAVQGLPGGGPAGALQNATTGTTGTAG